MIEVFINVITPVIFVFLIGYIIGKLFPLDQKSFSTVSIYILTPCLVFTLLIESKNIFSLTTLNIFISVAILTLVIYLAVELISKFISFPLEFKTVLHLTLILPNTGNFGMPVIEYAYGKSALPLASLLLIIYIIITNTVGVLIASKEKSSYKEAFKNILKIPVFYSMIIALLFNYFSVKIPDFLSSPIKSIGYSAIPVNLLLVGINLSRIKIDKSFFTVVIISMAKLIVVPLIASIILRLFNISGMEFKVTLLQIAMPSAIYSSILTTYFEGNERLASQVVLVSLFMSIFTLSFLIYFLS